MVNTNLTTTCKKCKQVVVTQLSLYDALNYCRNSLDFSIIGSNFKVVIKTCSNCSL
ncbi:hypothetical protein FDH01_gp148 [Acinetobacter phage vB_AbaM_ME3]|uniref:Uncharacterized protein n=1 Tax=Acinetobacter phage vB_AbaM_ME3 TaxID=1837876 RepID=A0A172Q0U2_9CAUD|nr:hypothetical protein FDH01_gp148 [Acinetobacter phage vB_AbaM_ME3]AND75474.1 hypothetical protein ME3_313 [Acinetobacter phage vB_AbaM_ME3]